jgi:hypothetical protein
MSNLLGATHLVEWAGTRAAQGTLPALIRRLILASVDRGAIQRFDFPSEDSVYRPGVDGTLQVTQGAPFVPAGQSIWEMGLDRDPRTKANADYRKRTGSAGHVVPSQTSFVFVTARRWLEKTDWVTEKADEHIWNDVRVLDADDLEQWLDTCGAVAAWACRLIRGLPAEGIHDLQDIWERWQYRTTPDLLPQLFLAGRATAAERVRSWLSDPPSRLSVRADSAEEAVAFIAAMVQTVDELEQASLRSRTILVTSPVAWRALSAQHAPLILLASDPTIGSDAQAVRRGHHVFLAYGNQSAGVHVDLALPHPRRNDAEAVLRMMGISSERAGALVAEARGRVTALIDLIGGCRNAPAWAAPAVAPTLVQLLLAGSWCGSEGDLEAMRQLCRVDADEISRRAAQWANEGDPPIRLVGGVWEWVARRRAWPHMGRFITAADLTAFKATVATVLGEIDPRIDLPPDERWMASVRNCAPRYSANLRAGLAAGLALMGTEPNAIQAGIDIPNFVAGTVRRLFGDAPDVRRWYSLATVLPTLAEAAPEILLDVIERDVLGNASVRAQLFQQEGAFGEGGRHCHLLWALERLAWSATYLARASVILAALAAPGNVSRSGNRPDRSLRGIYLPWHPNTRANASQRLAALDAVARQYEGIAFRLCLELVPRDYDVGEVGSTPDWRDWAEGRDQGVTDGDYWDAVEGAFDRLVRWAGLDAERWSCLLDPIPHVGPERIDVLVSGLEQLETSTWNEENRDRLRRSIRRHLHRVRTIEGLDSPLSDRQLVRLEAVYRRLEPESLVRRFAWLFDQNPELLSVTGDDWRAEQEGRERERREVIQRFVGEGAADQLLLIADIAGDAYSVG